MRGNVIKSIVMIGTAAFLAGVSAPALSAPGPRLEYAMGACKSLGYEFGDPEWWPCIAEAEAQWDFDHPQVECFRNDPCVGHL